MTAHILFWWALKITNANRYFRKNIQSLKYVGSFNFKMESGLIEPCTFVSASNDDKFCEVLRVLSNIQEKVKRDCLYLNA